MQVFKCVRYAEAGPEVEMELSVTDGSEIHEHNIAVGFLQSNRGVNGCGSGSSAAFGAEEGKDASFAGAASGAGAIGAETGQSLEQRVGAGAVVEVFSGTRSHGSHDGGGLGHAAIGEDAELQGVGLQQFDGFDGALRIVRRDINQNDLGAQVLNVAENRVGRSRRKTGKAADHASQPGGFEAGLQAGQTIAIFGEEGYSNAMHGAVLADFSRCLHVRKKKYSSPSDLGNRASWGIAVFRTEMRQA